MARLPVMRIRVSIETPKLVCAWARSKPARMSSKHLRVSGRCEAYSTGYGLPCDMCMATPGTWGMNVPIIPPHLGHSALCPIKTLLQVGFVLTLIPLLTLVLATTLVMSWKNYGTLELEQQRYLRTGFGAVSLTVFSMTSTHAVHHTLFGLNPFPMRSLFAAPWCTLSVPWKAQLRVFLPLRVQEKVSRTTCGILYWSCCFASRLAARSYLSSMKLTWLRSHSLVILLLIYSATRKVLTILHNAPSGTIARGVFYFGMAPLQPLSIDAFEDHEGSDPQLVCILCAIVSVCAPNHTLRRLWRPCLSRWTTQCLEGEQQRVPQASVSSLSHAFVPVPNGQLNVPFAKSRALVWPAATSDVIVSGLQRFR